MASSAVTMMARRGPLAQQRGMLAPKRNVAPRENRDATQEIVALGVCNIVSAFFQSIPVNGSFSRSAVSNASGVTPGSGIYTGIIVILTLILLTPYFYFIPRAALASVIVCAVLQMVDYSMLKTLWKTSRLDIIPLLGTFLCCLFLGIEIGLICGVAIDALLLLYYHSRPPLDVQYVDSMKMLVLDWSLTGRVIWCDARQSIKDQLSNVLPEPLFCESLQLRSYLIRPGEEFPTTNSDTAL